MARMLPILILLAFALSSPDSATAGIYDGTYGVIQPRTQEAMGFKVRRNNISKLRITLLIGCTTRDTGEQHIGMFLVSGSTSPHLLMGRNGRARGSFEADDAGRRGIMEYNIRFSGGRATAVVALAINNEAETCEGTNTYRLRRASLR